LIASFRARQWLALLAAGVLAGPIFASQWVEVGTSGVSTDKVMVDADSIQKIDEFKVADVMTVYAAPGHLRTAYGESIGTPARFRSQSKPARLGEEIGVIGYPLTGFLSANRRGRPEIYGIGRLQIPVVTTSPNP
jgi:hypothetical protein